jgi:hypothetical protein
LAASLSAPLTSGLGAPVGIGLGLAALGRVRRTGQRGRGLAVAGILVGSVFLLALICLIGLFTAASFGAASL